MSYDGSMVDLWGRGKNPQEALLDLANNYEEVARKARAIAEAQSSIDTAERIERAGDENTSARSITFKLPVTVKSVVASAMRIIGK